MELSKALAQKIVDIIYKESGFHGIVCDPTCTIIADSANKREGIKHSTVHQIFNTSINELVVTKEDEEKSQGKLKEGLNIAITIDGEKVGTFGVNAPVEIAKPVARVTAAIVSTLIRDEQMKIQLAEEVEILKRAVEEAMAAVQEMAASLEELASISQTVTTMSDKAQEEVKATEDVIDFIRRVAKQTKLLGLNASIEAARAGEHGKGFQVVAEEVRKLADESNRSANEIQEFLERFLQNMEQITEGIHHNNEITQEQAKAMQGITNLVEEVSHVGEDLDKMLAKLNQ